MKYYLSNILPRLKKFSASLDQSALLVDKPWVVSSVDEEDEGPRTTLIFRQDGRLHVSIEGEVHDGSWEFLPEANAVLIEQRDKKRLYKHAYLDEAVLALKKDTSSETDDFYVLADENRVPDGDVVGYLVEKLRPGNRLGRAIAENKINDSPSEVPRTGRVRLQDEIADPGEPEPFDDSEVRKREKVIGALMLALLFIFIVALITYT